MFWPIVLVGIVGLLVGLLRFRAPALLFAAVAVTALSVASGVIGGEALRSIAISTAAVLIAINCGYLVGMLLSFALSTRRGHQRTQNRSGMANS